MLPALTFWDVLLLTHPLGQLRVHHEVVDVLLRPGQLQLPADHGHQQRRATRALQRKSQNRTMAEILDAKRLFWLNFGVDCEALPWSSYFYAAASEPITLTI